ncbi:AMP-binding protein [Rickettsiella endosymbiont of Miltochrista miniata]|uniref:AMP-binding protein n=1 Tax=Rickettsiella endosymbiont of Miltochrista miniata TaxID=3066239 RepID=UPI00313EEC49
MKVSDRNVSNLENITHQKSNHRQEINNFWFTLKIIPKGAGILVSLANSVDLLYHVLAILDAGFVPILAAPGLPQLRLLDLQIRFGFHGFIQGALQIAAVPYQERFDIGGQAFYLCSQQEKAHLNPGEIILTTSGTSGFTSGCVFDVESLWRNAKKHVDAIQLTVRDTVLVNLPLYYSYAFVAQALAALTVGARLLITGPPFNESFFIKILQEKQITVISITPLLARRLLKANYTLPSSLRAVTIGGDCFTKDEIIQFLRLNPHQECYVTYGLTEAGPRVATLAAHSESSTKFASVGRVLPQIETHLQLKAEGFELYLKTDTCLKQRLGSSEKPTFHHLASGRWLQTGDCFQIDDDGYLFFQGRCANFFIIHGEKVNLAAVKQVVLAFPNVINVNTKLIQENNNILGYELYVVMNYEQYAHAQLSTYLKQYLYRYEQPLNIHIESVDSEELFLHK